MQKVAGRPPTASPRFGHGRSRRDIGRASTIHHPPWRLQRAQLTSLRSTMTDPHGLPTPAGPPLTHYAERQDTAIWPGHRLDGPP